MLNGSLCTGIGGLDLAVSEVFGTSTGWCAEIDPHAQTVITERLSMAWNLGDVKGLDSQLEGSCPSVVAAGFPCQDISLAGKGAGLEGSRSGLWFDVLKAIEVTRPSWVVIENVPALQHRGLDVVLQGLSEANYGGLWCFYRSGYTSDKFPHVGACHQRKRLFILAERGRAGFSQHEPQGQSEGVAAKLLPTPTASMITGPGTQGREGGLNLQTAVAKLPPTPAAQVVFTGQWGEYTLAIERWERTFGHPAPSPVTPDNKLNPPFVEWMMGYPKGWVTDLDIPRTQMLKMLGNSVQPQTAIAALTSMKKAVSND